MRGSLKIMTIRISLIRYLLYLIGFRQVRGHWIFAPSIKHDSIIIDLGANGGEFSKTMFENYSVRCYAIEPNKTLFEEIPDANLEKFNFAITKENTFLNFYISKNKEASSIIKDFENNWGIDKIDIVQGVTWPSLLDFLKLKDKGLIS